MIRPTKKQPDHQSGKVVIFDFDGTIADTFATSIHIFEHMTKRHDVYTLEEIERLRGLSGLKLIRELHIKPWLVPFMLARGRVMMRRRMNDINLFPGIKEVIADLYEQGVPLYIMSSNSPANIRKFMRNHEMNHYFKRIYGNIGLLGKARMLRRVMHQNHIDPELTTYVGDELRDIEGAKHVGIRVVAVGWGFNTADLLATHEPDVIVHTPKELSRALKP